MLKALDLTSKCSGQGMMCTTIMTTTPSRHKWCTWLNIRTNYTDNYSTTTNLLACMKTFYTIANKYNTTYNKWNTTLSISTKRIKRTNKSWRLSLQRKWKWGCGSKGKSYGSMVLGILYIKQSSTSILICSFYLLFLLTQLLCVPLVLFTTLPLSSWLNICNSSVPSSSSSKCFSKCLPLVSTATLLITLICLIALWLCSALWNLSKETPVLPTIL